MIELLPSVRGVLEQVARELAQSARTLQRQLRAEGTTFQAELAATRAALAGHYLAQEHLSIDEIAFLLGYDEPNSFPRAYRTWTGQTPHRSRRAAAS